jgi:LacI family transcriptional regulator
LASALATGRSQVIGLMLPSASSFAQHDPFYSLLTTGITSAAAAQGYNVMLYAAAPEELGQEAARRIDKMVAGMVFVSPPASTPLYAECSRQNIPYATILAGTESGPFTVNSDDHHGGILATAHLADLGHVRIAHLAGKPGVVTSLPRKRGYLEALEMRGIVPDAELLAPGEFTRKAGYDSAKRLLQLPVDRRPTAIFAANDLSAHGAIEAAIDLGLTVPGDVAVVGYDDTWYATVGRPSLTSVNLDVPWIGQCACEMILSFLERGGPAEAHLVLPVSLTIRESTGPPGSAELP